MSVTDKSVYMAHHFILLQLNPFHLSLRLMRRDGGLSTLCQSCEVPCRQRLLKTYAGLDYLLYQDRVV